MPLSTVEQASSRRSEMAPSGLLVGLDIGGTKTEALVVDQELQVRSRVIGQTVIADPEQLLASVNRIIYQALNEAGAQPQQLSGIGVGVPGQVHRETGEVRLAVNLNLDAYPLGSAITAEFNVPTFLENDVRTAAMGAHRFLRRSSPLQHMAYLSVGTGIAAGLVLDGRLYRGANGMAGEIGHVVVNHNGELCGCGLRGCLETVASGLAIARQAARFMPLSQKGEPLAAAQVYQLAQGNDRVAQAVVQRMSRYLSHAIHWLIMTYDVEKVVLGGGVSRAGNGFLEPILRELSQLRAQSSLARVMLSSDKIVILPADYNAGSWGAVELAQQGDWQQKV